MQFLAPNLMQFLHSTIISPDVFGMILKHPRSMVLHLDFFAVFVRLTKSHWKQKFVSLGAKRVSRQEVSSVALIVTRYPMVYTYEKQEGKTLCHHL
jgi:hypothetical protein